MIFQINPEDMTVNEVARWLYLLKGKRCWFSLTETETVFDRHGVERERPKRIVATVLRVRTLPDFQIRVDTTEGVLALGEFFSVEPYERFPNEGKDRYS